jgi:hypothetical protein
VRLACVVALLGGCGRVGFDADPDASTTIGDGSGSDALTDGPPNNPDAMDQTVTFGEDPLADHTGVTSDTYISQANGMGNNFGAADDIRIEQDNADRGLLRFDVRALPTTTTVLSASMRFYIETAAPGSTISIHRVREAWDEGNGDGTSGVANFTFRTGVIPWSLLGAAAPASIDPVAGTFSGDTLGTIDVPLPASMVQDWVSNPTGNFGVLFDSDSGSTVRLVSAEGQSSRAPVLTVTYE